MAQSVETKRKATVCWGCFSDGTDLSFPSLGICRECWTCPLTSHPPFLDSQLLSFLSALSISTPDLLRDC